MIFINVLMLFTLVSSSAISSYGLSSLSWSVISLATASSREWSTSFTSSASLNVTFANLSSFSSCWRTSWRCSSMTILCCSSTKAATRASSNCLDINNRLPSIQILRTFHRFNAKVTVPSPIFFPSPIVRLQFSPLRLFFRPRPSPAPVFRLYALPVPAPPAKPPMPLTLPVRASPFPPRPPVSSHLYSCGLTLDHVI